jgi:hypothetical protein
MSGCSTAIKDGALACLALWPETKSGLDDPLGFCHGVRERGAFDVLLDDGSGEVMHDGMPGETQLDHDDAVAPIERDVAHVDRILRHFTGLLTVQHVVKIAVQSVA